MPISVKDETGYKLVYQVWHKVSGTWVEVPLIHYKIGGAWKRVHEKITPFIFNQTISVNTYGYNLRESAILAGWNTTDPLIATVTVNVGVVVGAENYQNFGFSSGLSFPQASKLTLINNGTIAGMGGQGAPSGIARQFTDARDGFRGGTAIFLNLPTVLINNGSILAAGGGGGGGGTLATQDFTSWWRGASGGGGRGANTSLPGVLDDLNAGFGFNPDGLADDFAGSGGTLTTSGVGCSESGFGSESGFDYGGSGGVGGAIASAGADGILGNSSGELRRYYAFGKGGAAGKAIVGKSFITYEVTGTITGVQE